MSDSAESTPQDKDDEPTLRSEYFRTLREEASKAAELARLWGLLLGAIVWMLVPFLAAAALAFGDFIPWSLEVKLPALALELVWIAVVAWPSLAAVAEVYGLDE